MENLPTNKQIDVKRQENFCKTQHRDGKKSLDKTVTSCRSSLVLVESNLDGCFFVVVVVRTFFSNETAKTTNSTSSYKRELFLEVLGVSFREAGKEMLSNSLRLQFFLHFCFN